MKPQGRPEVIDQLVDGVDRYNPHNAGLLEDYLYHQIREKEYDCLANLAILKLCVLIANQLSTPDTELTIRTAISFNPDLYNPDVVINILIKALTAAPACDFNLCVALLGERQNIPLPDGEPDPLPLALQVLTQLSTQLLACRFPAFWAHYRSDACANIRENYTVEVVGFEDSVREVAIRAVTAAFKTITRKRLGSYLDLDDSDLDTYVESLGWGLDVSTSIITIPPNPDNQPVATVVRESIQLLTPCIPGFYFSTLLYGTYD
ncbi:eukaryotic translation initiation factor 3 subunit K [Ceratobasidium sp. AG-Ba]|nr:eukaryotic translation initiation factor 3 subunit K [Ceratobasidium sp. AG-Ba]